MKMEDATIQKLWIDTLFRDTKVVKWMSYVRLEFNIDFINQGVSCCMLNDTFFKCEIITIMVGTFETILSVNVSKERRF